MTSCSVSSWSILRFQATNIDFADDQGAFSCIIHERLLCLFIVCETMLNIGESRTIFANDTQAQHVAPNLRPGRFPPKLLWSENADFKFTVNNEGEAVNKKSRSRENQPRSRVLSPTRTRLQREHRLAALI